MPECTVVIAAVFEVELSFSVEFVVFPLTEIIARGVLHVLVGVSELASGDVFEMSGLVVAEGLYFFAAAGVEQRKDFVSIGGVDFAVGVGVEKVIVGFVIAMVLLNSL